MSAVTDGRGEFVVALWPGRYTITVAAEGFVEASHELRASQTNLRVSDFVLAVAGISEAVTVTAPARHEASVISSATKTATRLLDVPQSVTVVTQTLMKDQLMTSVGDVMRSVPASRCIRAKTTAIRSSCAATARRPTSSSTACGTMFNTFAICTTSIGSRRSRGRTR